VARPVGGSIGRLQIVEAALGLLRDEGIDALTMRKLGLALGVTPAAIYYHVPNKGVLIDQLVEELFSRVEWPPAGTWQERLRAAMRGTHATFSGYPGAVPILFSRVGAAPTGVRKLDEAMGWLFEAGFDRDTVARSAVACAALIIGHSNLVALRSSPGALTPDVLTGADLDLATLPNLLELGPNFSQPVGMADFEYGLDLIVGDLERQLSGPGERSRDRFSHDHD
jgi:AcrR family transcriptional regulator